MAPTTRPRPWLRRLLPPLAAAGAALLVALLAFPNAPAPLLSFESELELHRSWAGERKVYLTRHTPVRLVERDLETGAERDVPLPHLPPGYYVTGVGRTLLWAAQLKSDPPVGPCFAYDLATGQRLFTDTPQRRVQTVYEYELGEKLTVARVERWFMPLLRFQSWNPRTGKLETDRLLPLNLDMKQNVLRTRTSPDGRFVAIVLLRRRPKAYRWDTMVVEASSGAVLARRDNFELAARGWAADGAELLGNSRRGPQGEVWGERWDWRAQRLAGEWLMDSTPGDSPWREAFAWLPRTGEWLVHERRRSWTDEYPKVDEWLGKFGMRRSDHAGDSLWAIGPMTGQERLVASGGNVRGAKLLNSGRWALMQHDHPSVRNRFQLHATEGSYPWPWPWRAALALLAAIAAFLLVRRLLPASPATEPAGA